MFALCFLQDPKPKIYSVPFKLFKKTILLLLHGNPGRGVTFSQLRVELESFGGSSLDMRSLGFNSPNDMIKALEPDIQVSTTRKIPFCMFALLVAVSNGEWEEW